MNASELLDSRRVYAACDVFAASWATVGDDGKVAAFQSLLDLLPDSRHTVAPVSTLVHTMSKGAVTMIDSIASMPEPAAPKTRRLRRTKAQMASERMSKADAAAEARAPLTQADIARANAEVAQAQAAYVDPQTLLREAIRKVIKPIFANTQPDRTTGKRHFAIKADRGNGTIPASVDKWQEALKAEGLPSNDVEFRVPSDQSMIVVAL